MRVSSRKVAAFHAVEVPRMDSVSRWVGGPPFCCWWAEVRSRERGQGQIDSRDSGVASVRASGPLCPWPLAPGPWPLGHRRCFSKTPRPQLQAVSPPEEPQSRSGLSIKPMSLLGMWYLYYRSIYLGICFFTGWVALFLRDLRAFPKLHHITPHPLPYPNHHLSTTSGSHAMYRTHSTSQQP